MPFLLRFSSPHWAHGALLCDLATLPGYGARLPALSLRDHLGEGAWAYPEAWGWWVGMSALSGAGEPGTDPERAGAVFLTPSASGVLTTAWALRVVRAGPAFERAVHRWIARHAEPAAGSAAPPT